MHLNEKAEMKEINFSCDALISTDIFIERAVHHFRVFGAGKIIFQTIHFIDTLFS